MRRWVVVVLLVAGVLCAAVGVGLANRAVVQVGMPGAASFGWVAYSPLTTATYRPGSAGPEVWTHAVGLVLLALGAGTTGAAATALLRRRTAA